MTNVPEAQASSGLRRRIAVWIESPRIQHTIIALIVVNAITLGLETSAAAMSRFGGLLLALDYTVLSVFVVEIGLKLFAFGLRFFRSAWNVFDFLIVSIALIPASGPLTILRVLRVLRVLRLLSMVPRLRFVVEALLRSLPGIGSIAALMVVLFYVFAVMATGLFSASHPQWFGSVGGSMYTLFQIMTLESWSMGIVRPVMETYPYAWLFFVPFILLATFTILNLFIAVIVNTMQTMHEAAHRHEEAVITDAVHQENSRLAEELSAVRAELRSIKKLLSDGSRAPR
ncbi:MAG: ion transporter [Gammaproteobacteria bacterium]|nr:ion transporter [Gammaproteobacteria bacterium]MDJ0891518.1 ion transporter [Gammaproteobacteria bacterium]